MFSSNCSSLVESETSNFDVSRLHSSLVAEGEISLSDEHLSDEDNEPVPSAAITYNIVECGSEWGKAKLVSSDGAVSHTHPARPGIHTAVQIKAQCKNKGKVEVFESANNIVSSINNQLSDPSQPEAARANHNTLIRIINRARASYWPKDPSDLTFDLDLDYLEETIPEEFFLEEPL
ncbi:hypothetical protein E2C01_018384 [Portunus trituberculatus]|uniref:Uncharacterized protein n=1 Tax=Portunus trituberculatus TaxID=210409 RepID=A0A5B7DV07_PORTR|nr:hypothetical protein [Portunus trituberculatus]